MRGILVYPSSSFLPTLPRSTRESKRHDVMSEVDCFCLVCSLEFWVNSGKTLENEAVIIEVFVYTQMRGTQRFALFIRFLLFI